MDPIFTFLLVSAKQLLREKSLQLAKLSSIEQSLHFGDKVADGSLTWITQETLKQLRSTECRVIIIILRDLFV